MFYTSTESYANANFLSLRYIYEVSETLFRKQVSDDIEMFYLGRKVSETKFE